MRRRAGAYNPLFCAPTNRAAGNRFELRVVQIAPSAAPPSQMDRVELAASSMHCGCDRSRTVSDTRLRSRTVSATRYDPAPKPSGHPVRSGAEPYRIPGPLRSRTVSETRYAPAPKPSGHPVRSGPVPYRIPDPLRSGTGPHPPRSGFGAAAGQRANRTGCFSSGRAFWRTKAANGGR